MKVTKVQFCFFLVFSVLLILIWPWREKNYLIASSSYNYRKVLLYSNIKMTMTTQAWYEQISDQFFPHIPSHSHILIKSVQVNSGRKLSKSSIRWQVFVANTNNFLTFLKRKAWNFRNWNVKVWEFEKTTWNEEQWWHFHAWFKSFVSLLFLCHV